MRRPIPAASLAVVLAFVLAAPAAAQDAPKPKPDSAAAATKKDSTAAPDIVGAWIGSLDMQGQQQPVQTTIKMTEKGLVGTTTGMQGDVPLGDIKKDGDKWTAVASVPTPNGNIEVWYTFYVTGDSMSGFAEASVNGQSFQLPFTLKRQK